MADVAAIVLAAGASTRLGQPKQLLKLEGKTLIRRVVDAAVEAGCRPLIVVLGANAEMIAVEVEGTSAIVARNDDWSLGMGVSVRAGMSALDGVAPGDVDGVILAVCDQPLVTASTLHNLIDSFRRSGKPIAAAHYEGIDGVPALFGRAHFDHLRNLDPSEGARQIIRKYGSDVQPVDALECAVDVDTVEDWERVTGP